MFEQLIQFIELIVSRNGKNREYETLEVTEDVLASNLDECMDTINDATMARITIPARWVDEHYDAVHATLSELKSMSRQFDQLVEFKGQISEKTFEESGDVQLTLYRVPKFGLSLTALKSALSSTTTQ